MSAVMSMYGPDASCAMRSVMPSGQRRAAEHQRGDELARRLRGDRHVEAAAHLLAADAQRRIALLLDVLDLGADLQQHLDEIADRPLVHPLLAVQQEASRRERQPAGEEAHGRAGVADEDRHLVRRHRLRARR